MKYICSLITVENIESAKEFYRDIMKQTIEYDFGENVSFKGGFAIHQRAHFSKLIAGKTITPGGNDFELYFEFDDAASFAAELKARGVEFIHDVVEQPWRQRVMRFYDPDRHIIEVGESMEHCAFRLSNEGKTIDEIARITTMPAEFISAAIKRYSY